MKAMVGLVRVATIAIRENLMMLAAAIYVLNRRVGTSIYYLDLLIG